MKKKRSSKDEIVVKCFYNEVGEDVVGIIKKSFSIFIKNEFRIWK